MTHGSGSDPTFPSGLLPGSNRDWGSDGAGSGLSGSFRTRKLSNTSEPADGNDAQLLLLRFGPEFPDFTSKDSGW